MLEPTEEDRRVDPDVAQIAHGLSALSHIERACRSLQWRPEALIAAGLLEQLAALVEGDTPPGSA